MAFKFHVLAVAAAILAAPAVSVSGALAAPSGPSAQGASQPVRPDREPIVVAQAADFDVYVDGQGREIIVDSRTGDVVEVNPPGQRRFGERSRRQERGRQLGRGSYDLSNPRDRARFRRDREARQGLREPPPPVDDYDRSYDSDPLYDEPLSDEPLYGDRRSGQGRYGDDRGYDRNARQSPSIEQRGFDDGDPARLPEGGLAPDGGITRAPLDDARPLDRARSRQPSTGNELASVPGSGSTNDLDMRDAQPDRAPPPIDSVLSPGMSIVPPSGSGSGASENVAKFQVLLDRAGASPGVIDGRMGSNVNKGIDAYKQIEGQNLRTYDNQWIDERLEETGGPAFTRYTITDEDAAGPYVASLPSDYGEKAKLDRLGYTSVPEMLAERFHMDEDFLKSINPNADFRRPGTILNVVDPGKPLTGETVARIEADKNLEQVRAYNAGGRLVAAYPATIGSKDTPSPSGTHEVERVAFDPDYTYNPDINFKQGENDKVLTIPPGPNGPVGSIWIALSKPTYGIHGTPEPSTIGKTASHGCVRLTNWDATELAKMVEPGVTVTFVD